jgi:two-component sensor histidine kinase
MRSFLPVFLGPSLRLGESVFLFLSLFALGQPAFAQTDFNKFRLKIDSLAALLAASPDTVRVKMYKEMVKHAVVLGDKNAALIYARQSEALARRMRSGRALADAYHNFSLLYLRLSQYDSCLHYARKMLEAARESAYPERLSSAYNNMAKAYEYKGDYLHARQAYLQAEQVNLKHGFNNFTGMELYNIGMLNKRFGNDQEALLYFDKLAQWVEKLRRSGELKDAPDLPGKAQFGRIEVWLARKQYRRAADSLRTLMDFEQKRDRWVITPGDLHIRMGMALLALGKHAAALPYLEKALPLKLQAKQNNTLAEVYNLMGEAAKQRGNLPEAIRFTEQALQIGRQTQSKELVHAASLRLAQTHALQGDLAAAYRYQLIHTQYKDSIFDADQARTFVRLQGKHQADQQAKEIEILSQQSQIQSLATAQQRNQRNAAVAGGVLLALLAGVLYNRYRLKERSNAQLQTHRNQMEEKNRALQSLLGEKETLLAEKETLLKEVHHRVKNNLQLVSSLLNLQQNSATDARVAQAIGEGQSRLRSIALIHEKLYQSESLSRLDAGEYLRDLAATLVRTFSTQARRIELHVNGDPVQLDPDTIIRLGLTVNELVCNAFKYAFPAHTSGRIQVDFCRTGADGYRLRVSDTGVGMALSEVQAGKSLGLRLVEAIARQLGGRLSVDVNGGTSFSLEFNERPRL